jgi:hypothetical protein
MGCLPIRGMAQYQCELVFKESRGTKITRSGSLLMHQPVDANSQRQAQSKTLQERDLTEDIEVRCSPAIGQR